MKSNYRSRIAALAAEVVRSPRYMPPRPPFFVWPGEEAPPEAIRDARRQRSAIVYVYRASDGELEVVIDNVGDHITWSTPQACPMEVEKFHANLAKGELGPTSYGEWLRPEESLYRTREEQRMKTRDISPTAPGTTRISVEITDPKIAERPTIITPAAIAVGETSSGVPGAMPALTIPTPPERRSEAPSSVRPKLGGEAMPDIDMEGAPSSDPRYNPTASVYHAPPSNLPMTVSAAQIAREGIDRTYNIGPGNRAPLAGTVVDGFARLRRQAGGE